MRTLSVGKPKARKKHRCNFCFEIIPIGEIYDKHTNVYDGRVYDWKAHLKCTEIAQELNMYDNFDEGLTGDDFCEDIQQKYMEIQSNINEDYNKEKGFKYPLFKDQLAFVIKHVLTINQ